MWQDKSHSDERGWAALLRMELECVNMSIPEPALGLHLRSVYELPAEITAIFRFEWEFRPEGNTPSATNTELHAGALGWQDQLHPQTHSNADVQKQRQYLRWPRV